MPNKPSSTSRQPISSLLRLALILFITTFLGHTLSTGLAPAQAQPAAATLTITYLEAVAEESGEVRVSALVSVLTETGQPFTSLSAVDLSVSENSLPVDNQLLSVTAANRPLNVYLLLNTSSQMAETGSNRVRAIDAAKDAAIAFIEQLGQDDQVAIYEFNSQAVQRQALTYDHNLAIDQGVVPLDARQEEAACLNDALLQLIDQAAANSDTPQVIITFTGPPGGDSCGLTPVEDVLEAATTIGSSIPLFTLAVGDDLDEAGLQRLGQGSKGRTLLAGDYTDLAGNMDLILSQLKNQFQVSYPSSSAAGLATIIVFENNAQISDRRQLLIPQAVEPTPTPFPQFSIDLTVSQPSGDTLEITVANPENAELIETRLYLNDELFATATEPPFDSFILAVADLGSGNHLIRVEAGDVNGTSASAQVELMLTMPPTPGPTPSPTPAPTGAAAADLANEAAPAAATSTLPVLPLALICIGAGLLLTLGGLIVYLLISRSKELSRSKEPSQAKRPPPARQPAPASAPVRSQASPLPVPANPVPASAGDKDETMLDIPPIPAASTVPVEGTVATLVIISGEALLDQPQFSLQKQETRIGRREAQNDIVIKDPEVSRTHATITRQGQQYLLQDLNSTLGTLLNGVKLASGPASPLKPGDEIAIGPRVTFKFQIRTPDDDGETLMDMDFNELRTKLEDKDPFRTQYDE